MFPNPALSLVGGVLPILRAFLPDILGLACHPIIKQPGHFKCDRALPGVSSDNIWRRGWRRIILSIDSPTQRTWRLAEPSLHFVVSNTLSSDVLNGTALNVLAHGRFAPSLPHLPIVSGRLQSQVSLVEYLGLDPDSPRF